MPVSESVERRSGAIGLEPNRHQLGDDEGGRPLPQQRTESCMASTEPLRTPSAAVETSQIGDFGTVSEISLGR
jgi:hypothetical protein